MGESMVRRHVLACALVIVSGCGTPVPEVPVEEPVSYSKHIEPLVIAHCVGCHGAKEPKARLVLEEGKGYGDLVGRRSVQIATMMLVEPGDIEASYLWLKLQHRAPEGRGMPRTSTGVKKLRAAELDLYRRWIEGGAKP
jgi:hypothetical protein